MNENNNLKEEAIQSAVKQLNQGCCQEYVSHQVQEKFGFSIFPDELENAPGLLPTQKRQQNAWSIIFKNLDHEGNLTHLTSSEVQEKFGFDIVDQKIMYYAYANGVRKGKAMAMTKSLLIQRLITPEQALADLIDKADLSQEEAQKIVNEVAKEAREKCRN